jgi:release factor glutamine methyltransferase
VQFRRREFRCDPRALIPRPETEELAEHLLRMASPPAGAAVLDMGCGSGVLGLTLAAEWPDCQLTLADLSPEALALAKENAALLGIHNVSFVASDLFAALPGTFQRIVANLPYVPEAERGTLSREVLHDPALALFGGPDGLAVLRRFIAESLPHLAPGGLLALEIGHDQAAEVTALLTRAGFTDATVHPDLSGVPRFALARHPD